MPLPAFRHSDLDDGVLLVQLYVIEDVVGGVPDGRPLRQLLFRVCHRVRAVAQQKFCLHIPLGAGHHIFRPQLLEQGRRFQRVLEVSADGNVADVIVPNAQRAQKIHAGAVTDLCVGNKVHTLVDALLVPVHGHHLMPQLTQLHGKMPPEAAESDQ